MTYEIGEIPAVIKRVNTRMVMQILSQRLLKCSSFFLSMSFTLALLPIFVDTELLILGKTREELQNLCI